MVIKARSCAPLAYVVDADDMDGLSLHEMTEAMGAMYFQTKRHSEMMPIGSCTGGSIHKTPTALGRESIMTVDTFFDEMDAQGLDESAFEVAEQPIEPPTVGVVKAFVNARVDTFSKNMDFGMHTFTRNVSFLQKQTGALTQSIGNSFTGIFGGSKPESAKQGLYTANMTGELL